MSKMIIISLLAFLLSLVLIQIAYCVPALDSVRQLQQPDGTTFAARLWGDETGHGWETLDGYTVENTAFTAATAPNSLRYDGASSHVSVSNIF